MNLIDRDNLIHKNGAPLCDTTTAIVQRRPLLTHCTAISGVLIAPQSSSFSNSNRKTVQFVDTYDLAAFDSCSDIDSKLDAFNELIVDVLDEVGPEKTFVVNRPPVPWLTVELRGLKKERDACYRAAKRCNSTFLFTRYVDLRRDFKRKLSLSKSEYLQRKFEFACRTRLFWKEIDSLGLTKKGSQVHHVPTISPDVLNAYFSSVASGNILPSFEECVAIFDFGNIVEKDLEFNLCNTDIVSVESAIKRIPTNARGLDGFSVQEYKAILNDTLPVILFLFNESISNSVFPLIWKYSSVCPLPKVRYPSSSSDYRPISLLFALSKALERIIYNQATKYLKDYDLLDHRQTGFKESMRTQSAVLRFADDTRLGIDQDEVTVAVFLDFTKAFDTVDHFLLLSK
ncbi:uncharacterized protein LOC124299623 [Neodiprion virginianus]|uniref:uncharacterized protein LOC124299623 n=1 Tax=Neodiprion virginianus TaxID=2961670 RepID=UPI001EE6E52A|nr:uncharacterized protein LOC124299623 [Neodiprion virginianus]